jgi:hypothetical protein
MAHLVWMVYPLETMFCFEHPRYKRQNLANVTYSFDGYHLYISNGLGIAG